MTIIDYITLKVSKLNSSPEPEAEEVVDFSTKYDDLHIKYIELQKEQVTYLEKYVELLKQHKELRRFYDELLKENRVLIENREIEESY